MGSWVRFSTPPHPLLVGGYTPRMLPFLLYYLERKHSWNSSVALGWTKCKNVPYQVQVMPGVLSHGLNVPKLNCKYHHDFHHPLLLVPTLFAMILIEATWPPLNGYYWGGVPATWWCQQHHRIYTPQDPFVVVIYFASLVDSWALARSMLQHSWSWSGVGYC